MSARALSLLLLIVLVGTNVAQAQRCPGGKFARTPDRFAPCKCGYRPGPGGGDCRQYPANFCFPYQQRKLTCASRVSFFTVDSGNGPRPQFVTLRNYCDPGFSCTNRKDGPWCCPN